ncbi:hypothetical protein PM082_009991 [Marasmius tenuissimus]|nr:hypothetical protein PM082_009991 [Marasmius tenuissimus]
MDPFQRQDPPFNNVPSPFTTQVNVNSFTPPDSRSTSLPGIAPQTYFRPTSAAAALNANFLGRQASVGLHDTGGNGANQRWPLCRLQPNEIPRAQLVQPHLPHYTQQHNLLSNLQPIHNHHQNRDPRPFDQHWSREQTMFAHNHNMRPSGLGLLNNPSSQHQQSHSHINSAPSHSSRPSQQIPHQLLPSSPAPDIQSLGTPRSTMMPAARTPQPPLTLSQLRLAVNSSFDRRSVAPVQVQWQTPTVVNNVDALALHTPQPPPLFMPSPQLPAPELPFNPPSASLGPSTIDPANV